MTLNEQAGKPAKTVTIVHEDSAFGSGLAQLLNTQLPERGLLWQAVLDRKIDWIVSDHACCSGEQKWSRDDPTNIWLAKSGFGGTEYLLSGVVSEGSKRGMSYNHMAELLCWKPAQRFGLLDKGDIARGFDADIVLVDPHDRFVVRAAESESKQEYSPFEGQELTGRVKSTFLRGALVYHDGKIIGPARGRYMRRPLVSDTVENK